MYKPCLQCWPPRFLIKIVLFVLMLSKCHLKETAHSSNEIDWLPKMTGKPGSTTLVQFLGHTQQINSAHSSYNLNLYLIILGSYTTPQLCS